MSRAYNRGVRAAVNRTWPMAPRTVESDGFARRAAPRKCKPKCMGCVLCGGGRTVPNSARERKIRADIAAMQREVAEVFGGQEYNKFGREA